MTLGAFTLKHQWIDGNRRVRVYDVVLGTGANYPTGGESVLPTAVGLRSRIDAVIPCGVARATADGATGRTLGWDDTNKKLQVYTTGSAEAGNNSDQSGQTARIMFVGK